uniref:MFS general substrate transporter n=1 Tax=Mycena chlorophos TaxID=658473 RepID=A0ABQ0L842_MYCCL|nr:MFS general substrate transporter [Mycena chlorophos]
MKASFAAGAEPRAAPSHVGRYLRFVSARAEVHLSLQATMSYDERPRLASKRTDSEQTVLEKVEPSVDAPACDNDYPEGGVAGWLTVLGAFMINFCGFGYTTAFGVYQDFYVRDYLSQSSPSAISWIGSLNAFLGVAFSLISGPLYDRGYVRSVIYAGCAIQAISLFMLSLCQPQQLYQVLLAQGVGLGVGLGLVYVPTVAVVSHYFNRRRSLVMALTQAGTPLGGLVHPILLNNLLPHPGMEHRLSFAGATRVSAALGSGFMLVGCLLIWPRPEMIRLTRARRSEDDSDSDSDARRQSSKSTLRALRTSLKKAIRDRPYVLATCAMVTYIIAFWYPIFYLQLEATTHGMSQTFAFYVLVMMNGSGLIGRLSAGFAADYFGVTLVITTATGAGTLLIFSMFFLRTVASVVVISVMSGFFIGLYAGLLPSLLASLTDDHSEVGLRMGISFTIEGIGGLVGPPICGALLTSQFVWWRPTLFSGIMGLGGFVLFCFATLLRGKWSHLGAYLSFPLPSSNVNAQAFFTSASSLKSQMAQAPPPKYPNSDAEEYDTAANANYKPRAELIKLKLRQSERMRAEWRRPQGEIVDEMRYLAAKHPEAAERADKTKTFDDVLAAGGSEEEKAHVLMEVGRGLGMIIVAPFMLVGGVLYGVGTVVKGLGTFFSGGKFGR